jgi:hypothetical protein
MVTLVLALLKYLTGGASCVRSVCRALCLYLSHLFPLCAFVLIGFAKSSDYDKVKGLYKKLNPKIPLIQCLRKAAQDQREGKAFEHILAFQRNVLRARALVRSLCLHSLS